MGAGVTIALIDTGVVADQPEIAGRVSPLSSCAAVTFTCSSGFTDDHGHGTATAAIAAGAYNASTLMSGVAPAATILSEKVLDATGSGYDTDVANGIVKAADAGAQVISLSLTYIPTPDVVTAINYATAKGAVIVWAGGNSAAALNGGADTTGLTDAALSRLILVGSVSSTNQKSSFSNFPGVGSARGATASSSYAGLWLMAPGENIWAPAIQYGSNYIYSTWSGTSMSTPEVAGAVALLEATWPILRTNGTAAALLFASATDLGTAGVDSSYGHGLLNLTAAFQPVGPLSVYGTGGSTSTVTGTTGTVSSTGALGGLPGVKSVLSRYTAFDGFERNFTVDLSHLVATASTSVNAQPVLAAPVRTASAAVPGGWLTLAETARPSGLLDGQDEQDRLWGHRDRRVSTLEFVGASGSYLAIAHGAGSTLSLTRAGWGAASPAAEQASDLGVATALNDLAQGGDSAVAGAGVFGRLRVAAGWSSSPDPVGSALASDRARARSSAVSVTTTFQLSRRLRLGATLARLDETNALLGSTYSGLGPLSLGDRRGSRLEAFSAAAELGGGRSLLAEAAIVDVDGARLQSGLISEVSPLRARAFGVSFQQRDAFRSGDALSVAVRKPLRVVSGQAMVAESTVDQDGRPVTTFAAVSLKPSGDETDVSLRYAAPLGRMAAVRLTGVVRQDADNQAGVTDVGVRMGLNLAF